ncbi:MAG: hypothetical protein HGA97_11465 [Chlorobiaceae bacterium]|nr:hypothetical protein [Chlorobiaceae bacterium]
MSSPLVLNEAQETPLIIDKNLVHKKSEKNVLISSPFTTGWIHHFNMFCDTTELIFDHDSEHIQGLLISEALRQTGIACAHIQGLPPEGKLVLLNFNTNFFNFVERKSPIIMRAYCDFHPCDSGSDKNISFYIQVLQWGRICVDSSITTFACMNTFRQQQLNNRLIKIAARQKTHFDAKIFNHLKTNSES